MGSEGSHPVKALAFLAAGLLGLAVLASGEVRAIDGSVDVRDSRQTGSSGGTTFSTHSRRTALSLRQRVALAPGWALDGRFQWLREVAGNDLGEGPDTERRSYGPSLHLSYRRKDTNAGLRAGLLLRRHPSGGGQASEADRYQYGAWINTRPDAATRLSGTWTHTVSEERNPDGNPTTRQHSGLLEAQRRLTGSWRFEYRLSSRSSNLVHTDTRRQVLSHGLELGGSPSLGSRAGAFLNVQSRFYRESVEVGSESEADVLLLPTTGGFVLDDTPETLDPLEGDPTPEPALYDGDLEGPTRINLGDDASVVREFGGDYRNIQYDLGRSEELSSATLYIDTTLLNPELYRWRVFVSDDPDGRLWNELRSDQVAVAYREWGSLLQGWEVALAPGVSGRFFKMVNEKLGSSIPELFVTELEVFRREVTHPREIDRRSQDHRVSSGLNYRPVRNVQVGYRAMLRRRTFDEDSRRLDEVNQSVDSRWSPGRFVISLRGGTQNDLGDTRRKTNVRSYGATAAYGLADALTTTLSWSRTEDRTADRDRDTDVASASVRWKAFRRLRFNHRVSHGWRADNARGSGSRSFSVVSSIDSRPFLSLGVDLERTDRWVSAEAGSGFERFNDTNLSLSWSPAPLVTLASAFHYHERRDESDWTARNTVSWSPFPDALVKFNLSGTHFFDSRTDTTRYGGSLSARWRVSRALAINGSVHAQRFVTEESETPVNTTVHGVYTF